MTLRVVVLIGASCSYLCFDPLFDRESPSDLESKQKSNNSKNLRRSFFRGDDSKFRMGPLWVSERYQEKII